MRSAELKEANGHWNDCKRGECSIRKMGEGAKSNLLRFAFITAMICLAQVASASEHLKPGMSGHGVAVEPVDSAPAQSPEKAEAALALTHAQRVLVQRGLRTLEFDVGPADGLFGPRTRDAIGNWQASRGELATGYLHAGAAETLLEAGEAARPPEPQRIVVQGAMDTLAEALGTVPSIFSDNERASVLSEIAVAQAKAGDRRGAARSITEALSIVPSIIDKGEDPGEALREIAEAQLKMGDIGGALDTARSIAEVGSRLTTFHKIAEAQAKAGDRRGAARSITEALSTEARAKASEVAKARAKASEVAAARSLAAGDEIGASVHRHDAEIQTIMADIDDSHRAITSQIGDAISSIALSSIVALQARLQAESGDIAGARSTVRSIASESSRAEAFRKIALAQAESGDIAGARSTARSMAIDWWRAGAFSDIAVAQAKAGDRRGAARSIAEALSTVRADSETGIIGSRAAAFREIAVAQAKVGDQVGAAVSFAEARLNAGTIEADWSRGHLFMQIAEAQAKAGDRRGAAVSFAEARLNAGTIEAGWSRGHLFMQIAEAQANTGDIAGALSIARSIEGFWADWFGGLVLGAIAEAQAKAGDIAGALGTARSIEGDWADWRRAAALTKIAVAQLSVAE